MRIRTLLFSLGFFIMLGLSWLPFHSYAQSEGDPGNTLPPGGTITGTVALYLPLVSTDGEVGATPTPSVTPTITPTVTPTVTPTITFSVIPVQGPPVDRPAATNPDLNLAIRSYVATTATLGLIDSNGNADSDAPQLAGIFSPPRLPTFMAVYQVYDWNWNCGADGCLGNPITSPPVTLLEMAVTAGEPLFIPTRNQEIYGGGYKVLVLYAEETRITLAYTRQDSPAHGYLVHLEEIAVDPALLALYQAKDAAGRAELPALRNNERFANAGSNPLKVAIRDTGSFMDPRVRKDWWVGY